MNTSVTKEKTMSMRNIDIVPHCFIMDINFTNGKYYDYTRILTGDTRKHGKGPR